MIQSSAITLAPPSPVMSRLGNDIKLASAITGPSSTTLASDASPATKPEMDSCPSLRLVLPLPPPPVAIEVCLDRPPLLLLLYIPSKSAEVPRIEPSSPLSEGAAEARMTGLPAFRSGLSLLFPESMKSVGAPSSSE